MHSRETHNRGAGPGGGVADGPLPVAFVTDALGVGGAEAQLVELVRALDPSRVRACVAVLRETAETISGRLETPPVRLDMRGPRDLAVRGRLASWLRDGGFRAVYTTHTWSTILTASIVPRLQVPGQRRAVFLHSEHSFEVPPASRMLEPVRRRAAASADRIVAVSGAQARWLLEYLRLPPSRIRVLPNGVDLERFAGLRTAPRTPLPGVPPGAPLVACIGRFVPVKAHDRLLDAFGILVSSTSAGPSSSTHLALLGSGPLRDSLEASARAAGLGDRVHFLPPDCPVEQVYAAADLVCLASRSESQGLVLVEAMAAGVPVVATAVGGVPEVVVHGTTGWLVPFGDANAFAAALRRLIEDPQTSRRMGEAGRERARARFSIQVRARKLERWIEALVARRCR